MLLHSIRILKCATFGFWDRRADSETSEKEVLKGPGPNGDNSKCMYVLCTFLISHGTNPMKNRYLSK